MTPLSYIPLESATPFTSEQCPEGIVSVSQNTLRVLVIEQYGGLFNQKYMPLKYTPRKMIVHQESNRIVLIESDHNTKFIEGICPNPDMQDEEKEDLIPLETGKLGPPNCGKWASCIRIVDPVSVRLRITKKSFIVMHLNHA